MWRRALLAGLLAASAAPATAERVEVHAPAGRASDVAIEIARQTGSSIVIADARLAQRSIGTIRGRMDAQEAVRRLARALRARAVPAGSTGWRLVAQSQAARPEAPPRQARPATPPPSAPPPMVPAEPIVVVASKRELRLGEFAGQVTIVDGEALHFGGVGGTEKLTQRSAAVSSTHLGSGRNKLFIRGIADSSFTGPTQATVGQYLGDLRLSYNAPDPDLRLSDLERVEILEGPQGTLYGAGSLGGIIRLVPNMPKLGRTEGAAMVGGSLTQHGEPSVDFNAMFNLPLAQSSALRLTVDAASQGGYIDKPLLGRDDVNRTGILGGRAIVRTEVAPGWTVDVLVAGQDIDARDSQYADRSGPPLSRNARVQEGSDAGYMQGQAILSGELGAVRLRSTTGLTSQDLEERYDATLPEGPARLFVQHNDTRMFAHETRLWQKLDDRFGWLAGISFTHNRTRLTRSLGELDTPATVTGVTNTIDEATIYGEASLRLFEGLIATGGARVTHSRLGGEGEDVARAIAMARAEVTADRSETVVLPSASLVAQFGPASSLYLRYQEGFRPGGLAIEGDFVRRFDNDHTSTFELGARHGGHDGSYDLSASIAYTRWTDIQADFLDSAGFPSTANIGDGRIWTATLTAGAQLLPGLRLEGGLTYNDSSIDQLSSTLLFGPAFDGGPASSVENREQALAMLYARASQVPNIARFAGRLGFDYERRLDDRLSLTMQGWASYVGKSRLGLGPELGEAQGDYLDSGITARIGHDRLGLSLGITNLADTKGNRFALGTPFAIGREQITPLRPRTIRVGIDASF